MAVDLLNQNIGIGSVLPSYSDNHLPSVDDFSTVTKNEDVESLLKDNFSTQNTRQFVMKFFEPEVSSDEFLKESSISANLSSALDKLSTIKDTDIRRFVREDLEPLLENKALFHSYCTMMIGG